MRRCPGLFISQNFGMSLAGPKCAHVRLSHGLCAHQRGAVICIACTRTQGRGVAVQPYASLALTLCQHIAEVCC